MYNHRLLNFKTLLITASIWIAVAFIVAFFMAALIGGRGGDIILWFGFISGLIGWVLHIGCIKITKSISGFPTVQPFFIGLVSLCVISAIATALGSPKPMYAAVVMIFMFGSLPTLFAAYIAHWALLKLNHGDKSD